MNNPSALEWSRTRGCFKTRRAKLPPKKQGFETLSRESSGNCPVNVEVYRLRRRSAGSVILAVIAVMFLTSAGHTEDARPHPSTDPQVEQIAPADDGYVSLFEGMSFAGWKHLPGHKGHWIARDDEIHYDGKAESKERTDKDLWTEKAYKDFVLVVDWRLPAKPTMKPHPVVLPSGDFVFEGGQRKTFQHPDAGDSGIYLRGDSKCQINIWSQQLGSGEINGYRTDNQLPPEIRKACIPTKNADHEFGQWNRFVITMRGQRVSVVLNDETVINDAQLPGVPERGPIGLQHHNDPVQFRNLFIKELN